MRRPSFLQGVAVALVASLAGAASFAPLASLLGPGVALRLLIPLLGLAYVLYLLSRSATRVGRVVTVAAWLAASAATWLLAPPLALYAVVHVGLIWLVRSLYLYSSVACALADLGLVVLGALVAVGTIEHTGSLFLALWSFFLVQAASAAIPTTLQRSRPAPAAVEEPFERARRVAEAALKRIYASES